MAAPCGCCLNPFARGRKQTRAGDKPPACELLQATRPGTQPCRAWSGPLVDRALGRIGALSKDLANGEGHGDWRYFKVVGLIRGPVGQHSWFNCAAPTVQREPIEQHSS